MNNYQKEEDYKEFAERVKREREEEASRRNFVKSDKVWEQPEWVSLSKDKMSIIRIVSAHPKKIGVPEQLKGIEVFISDVKDDLGNWFRLKLPLREDRPSDDHVFWRMINKINEVEWVDKKKHSVWESRQPALFERINKGGWKVTEPQYQFSKGLGGQKMCILNVIDRSDMEWHRQNKHTKLLSKDVSKSTDTDGNVRVWATQGVPSFGFLSELEDIVSRYGYWDGYDVGIQRTSIKTAPNRIYNASAMVAGKLKEIPDDVISFVVQGELTDEEGSWETYNLKKMFSPTSYYSLLKHFSPTLKEFDAAFGTDYYDEVKAKADNETKEYQESQKEVFPVEKPEPHIKVEERTVTREPLEREVANTKISPEKLSKIKRFNELSPDKQNQIIDVELNRDGTIRDIKYTEGTRVLACPECKVPSPNNWSFCPACGINFS